MSTSEIASSKLYLDTECPLVSQDIELDSPLTEHDLTYMWQPFDLKMEHHVPYQTHIRRLSSPYDPFVQHFDQAYHKPVLQMPVQQQYVPGWQMYQHNTADYRQFSPMSRVSSSSGLDRSLSMSPEMATAMLASMVDDPSLYSPPEGASMGYHALPSAMPTGTTTYSPPTPVLPSQPFSMKDFQHFPDSDEPPLLDEEDLFQSKVIQHMPTETMPLGALNDLVPSQTLSSYTGLGTHFEHHFDIEPHRYTRPFPPIKANQTAQSMPKAKVHTTSRTTRDNHPKPQSNRTTATPQAPPTPTSHQSTPTATKKHARTHSSPSKSTKKRRLSTTTTTHQKAKPLLPCPFHHFGCPATFPNKNEWKRHTLSQHLRLGFYRCHLGTCNINHPSGVTKTRGFNDFNRKDLFVQHLRRMHAAPLSVGGEGVSVGGRGRGKKAKGAAAGARRGIGNVGKEEEEAWIEDVRRAAWVGVRVAPGGEGSVGCGFCDKEFGGRVCSSGSGAESDAGDSEDEDEGEYLRGKQHASMSAGRAGGSGAEGKGQAVEIWEQRMEHVAAHYAKGCKVQNERLDERLKRWAVSEGLVVEVDGGDMVLASLIEAAPAGTDAAVIAGQGQAAEAWGQDAVNGSVAGTPAEPPTGVRRKGKTSRLGATAAVRYGARAAANSPSNAAQSRLENDASYVTAVGGRPGYRKSERLSGGQKRRYAEYEESELSVSDAELENNDDTGRVSKRARVAADDDGSDEEGNDDENDENADNDQGGLVVHGSAGSDSDTDAAGEDDD